MSGKRVAMLFLLLVSVLAFTNANSLQRKHLQTIIISVGGLTDNTTQPTAEVEMYSWTDNTRPALADRAPEPRTSFGSVIINQTVYLLGGWNGANYTNTFWSYSVQKNHWNDTALPAIPRNAVGSAALHVWSEQTKSDLIYLLGGESANGSLVTDVLLFNFTTANWITLAAPLPSPSLRPCFVIMNNTSIFYLTDKTFSRTDDGGQTWSQLRLPNILREEAACIALGKESILLTGGKIASNGTVTNSTELYNTTSNTWTAAPEMVWERAGHAVEHMPYPGNDVLVCGGEDVMGNPLKACEVFYWNDNKWQPNNYDLETPRYSFGMFVASAKIRV